MRRDGRYEPDIHPRKKDAHPIRLHDFTLREEDDVIPSHVTNRERDANRQLGTPVEFRMKILDAVCSEPRHSLMHNRQRKCCEKL